MASLKFNEVTKLLNARFNDETSRCQAEIASNDLQKSDVYQLQESKKSNPQSEEEQIIRTIVEDIRITFKNGQLNANEIPLELFNL